MAHPMGDEAWIQCSELTAACGALSLAHSARPSSQVLAEQVKAREHKAKLQHCSRYTKHVLPSPISIARPARDD